MDIYSKSQLVGIAQNAYRLDERYYDNLKVIPESWRGTILDFIDSKCEGYYEKLMTVLNEEFMSIEFAHDFNIACIKQILASFTNIPDIYLETERIIESKKVGNISDGEIRDFLTQLYQAPPIVTFDTNLTTSVDYLKAAMSECFNKPFRRQINSFIVSTTTAKAMGQRNVENNVGYKVTASIRSKYFWFGRDQALKQHLKFLKDLIVIASF